MPIKFFVTINLCDSWPSKSSYQLQKRFRLKFNEAIKSEIYEIVAKIAMPWLFSLMFHASVCEAG